MGSAKDKNQTSALCAVLLFSNKSLQALRGLVKHLKNDVNIEKISSIYQVLGNPEKFETIHDIRSKSEYSGLCVVLRVSTDLSAEKLFSYLNQTSEKINAEADRRFLSINLLSYGNMTLMTPNLTLPHPDFHRRAEFLMPSSEVWGDLEHPVLKESLAKLTSRFIGESWGEFFAQGQSLM